MIAADLAGVRVWLASTPVDLRKSFDGLAEVVRSFLKDDPLSGHLFVFRNRGGHLVKILWWDTDGLAIYYKRHESNCPLLLLCTRNGERADNFARWLVAASGMDASTTIRGPRRWFMHSDVTLVAPPRAHRPTCRRRPIHCGVC